MPSFCAALHCRDKYGHEDAAISFHKFPLRNAELLQKWLEFVQRDNWKPSKWSSICSRHFRPDDFSCGNERKTLRKDAIPTIVSYGRSKDEPDKNAFKDKTNKTPEQSTDNESDEHENETNSYNYNGSKLNCRLCGQVAQSAVTFSCNFEIYGMIQKCFPMLNIKQDDSLPKDMCGHCLKKLKSFSAYIDMVMQTQSELQRKYRSEKQTTKAMEKQLKIKQEPLVRVKQEDAEEFDSFIADDLDCGGDDNCDPDNQNDGLLDSKSQFFDFPLLNTQDIINNCDIMEIINLDDPFINIPDDDINGTGADCVHFNDNLPSKEENQNHNVPDDLLASAQREDHNYAHPPEDESYEDWKSKKSYKTEKTDGYDQCELQAAQNYESTPIRNQQISPDYSAMRPMVTSMSSTLPISESQLTYRSEQEARHFSNGMDQEQNISATPKAAEVQRKPNIVVLNESIVNSTAFQLHTCTQCNLKFFGIESLNQHFIQQHTSKPMVSVPFDNVRHPLEFESNEGITADLNPIKNKINILNVQQSFSNPSVAQCLRKQLLPTGPEPEDIASTIQEVQLTGKDVEYAGVTDEVLGGPISSINQLLEPQRVSSICTAVDIEEPNGAISKVMPEPEKSEAEELDRIINQYRKLQRHMYMLKRKCQRLRVQKFRFTCAICKLKFPTIRHLLRHKQQLRHFTKMTKRNFIGSCPGCEKFFNHKIALSNHMRFVCNSVSLRVISSISLHMRTFKCRYCRRMCFNHWRLYRKHETGCKLKQRFASKAEGLASKPKRSRTKQSTQTKKMSSHSPTKKYTCTLCDKVFKNSKCLSQHRTTHKSERVHRCSECKRVFKRRNGLMQHYRGFHLKIKPHECPVCQHRYSLKNDMLRCRHSDLQKRKGGKLSEHNRTPTDMH